MQYKHIHFLCEQKKAEAVRLAQMLIKRFGQSSPEKADLWVSIGGDGISNRAHQMANGVPVYAVWPPGSSSVGYCADHEVTDDRTFVTRVENGKIIDVAPVRAELTLEGGERRICRAFNDVSVRADSEQAVISRLSYGATKDLYVMGDGFIFSNARGSTGSNRSYGGPVVDIETAVLIMTGKGIYNPLGMPSVKGDAKTVFCLTFDSAAGRDCKRPVAIGADGRSVASTKDVPISGMVVSLDTQNPGKMILPSRGR